jgi:hypothetical protein
MTTEKLPNKCDCCGLKQVFPPDSGDLFTELAILYEKGIIKQSFSRKLFAGGPDDRDEFCLISNPAWKDINTPCDDWELYPLELSKSDYLSLNSSKKAIRSAESTEGMTVELADMTNRIKAMTKLMLWVTFFSAIAAGLSAYVATDEWLSKSKRGNITTIPTQTKMSTSQLPKKSY